MARVWRKWEEGRENRVRLFPPVPPPPLSFSLSFSCTFPLIAVSRFHSLPLDRRASRINVSEIQLRVPWQLSESSRIQLMLTMRASLFPPLLPRIRLKYRTESTAETSAMTREGEGETLSYKTNRNDEQVEKCITVYAPVNVTSGLYTPEKSARNGGWEDKSGWEGPRSKGAREKNPPRHFLHDFSRHREKKRAFQFVGASRAFTVSFTTLRGKHIVSSRQIRYPFDGE